MLAVKLIIMWHPARAGSTARRWRSRRRGGATRRGRTSYGTGGASSRRRASGGPSWRGGSCGRCARRPARPGSSCRSGEPSADGPACCERTVPLSLHNVGCEHDDRSPVPLVPRVRAHAEKHGCPVQDKKFLEVKVAELTSTLELVQNQRNDLRQQFRVRAPLRGSPPALACRRASQLLPGSVGFLCGSQMSPCLYSAL